MARFVWTPGQSTGEIRRAQAAPSSALVICFFDPARRAVLTTDKRNASNVAIATILKQPNDEGHPMAKESRKLTAN